MSQDNVRVLSWSELSEPRNVYPKGINVALADYLDTCEGIEAKTASIDDPEQGLSDEVVASTDVLIWFGHVRHGDVTEQNVAKVVRRVREEGMGFLPLHSSHFSKPLKALTGTSCAWRCYVEDGKSAWIRVVKEDHPIASGVSNFVIPQEEWYGEPFDIPQPDEVVLGGTYCDFQEVARDGVTWTMGKGRVFYFRPGHETFPIYYMQPVRKIIENAVRWLARKT